MVNERGQTVYSYSQLTTFQQCPYAWSRLYIDKVPREGNAFASYGSLVHKILEKFARGELPRSSLADVFAWRFDTDIPEPFPKNKYVELRPRYYQQGLDFFQNFEGFDGLQILGIEEHFELDRQQYALQGYIDLIYRDQTEKLVCRDWKSTKKYTASQLSEHATQVYLYSAHCRQRFGAYPDYLEFYHFRDGREKSVIRFNPECYRSALSWADRCVETINQTWVYDHRYDDFFCNNLCSCRSSCEYREAERKKSRSVIYKRRPSRC